MNAVSGPMFEGAEDDFFKSTHGKRGGHYNTFGVKTGQGMAALRLFFPDGEANAMNFVLFSTSGVHGSYTTIEEIELSLAKYGVAPAFLGDEDAETPDDFAFSDLTFVIVQPRLCTIRYGNAEVTPSDIGFLKKLRASSHAAVQQIGADDAGETGVGILGEAVKP